MAGTAYGQQLLIDDSDLFGGSDEDSPSGSGRDLGKLRARFEQGEWAERWPSAVEVPVETLIGDRLVRGRIDAVFADSPQGYDVVDWKTGRPPGATPSGTRSRSSWPPTGWPGPRWPECRSPQSGRRSTTWPTTPRSGPPTCSVTPLAALIDQIPAEA